MPLLYSVALFTGCHPRGGQPLAEKPESLEIVALRGIEPLFTG